MFGATGHKERVFKENPSYEPPVKTFGIARQAVDTLEKPS